MTPNLIETKKKNLREQIQIIQKNLSSDFRKKADENITEKLMTLPEFVRAGVIFSYISTSWEPDTKAIIQLALSQGKQAAVPKCCDDHTMRAVAIQSLEACRPNAWGILEPDNTFSEILPEQIDLAIIPCIAASPKGKRLGHGGGFYDRFLSEFSGIKCCLCYSQCLRTDIPVTKLDIPMDMVICENGIFVH